MMPIIYIISAHLSISIGVRSRFARFAIYDTIRTVDSNKTRKKDTVDAMENKRIVFLDYLRVTAIFMVMMVHCCEQFYFNANGEFHIANAEDAFWVTFFDSAVRSCVPLFVMASAYLLFPVTKPTAAFLPRRILRVFIPFLVWEAIYTIVWHGEWLPLAFNFQMATSGHLWFIPMLLGLYLLMPLLSPWAEKASKRELGFWIALWLVTTTFPFVRELWHSLYGAPMYGAVPFIWGECPWNAFGTFHYVSGFFGFLLLGFYSRKFAAVDSWAKTLAKFGPLWLVGFLITTIPFYFRIPAPNGYPTTAPYSAAVELEMSWGFCSTGVVLMTIALFAILRKFDFGGGLHRYVIRPLSEASFGVYLLHMFVLVEVVTRLRPHMPTPTTIVVGALATYAIASVASLILRKIPHIGKWICG